jgi:hypothetical protein
VSLNLSGNNTTYRFIKVSFLQSGFELVGEISLPFQIAHRFTPTFQVIHEELGGFLWKFLSLLESFSGILIVLWNYRGSIIILWTYFCPSLGVMLAFILKIIFVSFSFSGIIFMVTV